jgi:hypothetical protein
MLDVTAAGSDDQKHGPAQLIIPFNPRFTLA